MIRLLALSVHLGYKAKIGKQVRFHMLPDDCELFVDFLMRHDPIAFAVRDSSSPEVESLAAPCANWATVSIWNRSLCSTLSREFIVDGPYYRIIDSQPILELSPCQLTDWNGTPALLQGRIWGAFKASDRKYATWFDAIARWIRKNYAKNDSLEGYVSKAAESWSGRGGLLLPAFKPPLTEAWREFFDRQTARASGTDHK